MADLFGNIVNFVFALIGIAITIGIIVRISSNYFSKEKEVKATVINKQSYDKQIYRNTQAPFTQKNMLLHFNAKIKNDILTFLNCLMIVTK